MTTEERVAALARFGYSPDESRFLTLAALHSGYFLRRQFLSFVGSTKGWKDDAFIDKLEANRHCQGTVFRHNRVVYRLCAKPFYAALGEEDNRNRRERQPSTIKNKLMGLDFVLAHPQHDYLATEPEKLAYFCGTLDLADQVLPTRWYTSRQGRGATAKHFVEKFPLFLAVPSGGTDAVVHFTYVDEGAQSTDGFYTYLCQYRRLLAALPDFRIVYITQRGGLLQQARREFELMWPSRGGRQIPLDPERKQLLAYFAAREQYEARDFSQFDTQRLIRYREEKRQFAGERYETLYTAWKTTREVGDIASRPPEKESPNVRGELFAAYVLPHNYDLFGTLTTSPRMRERAAPDRTQS